MNYKMLIPSKKLRLKILKSLDFIPDEMMLKIQYFIKMGTTLNLASPTKFTEKIQWYKLYYRDPLMTQCADKVAVRQYITDKGYSHLLVPLLGIYQSPDEIDFDLLPNKFVLKTTNNSQTVIICTDKSTFNIDKAKHQLKYWLYKKQSNSGREWAYNNIPARIICEEYLEKDEHNNLTDYKFLTFDGRVEFIYVITGEKPNNSRESLLNRSFELLPVSLDKIPLAFPHEMIMPSNLDQMILIAEDLATDFPQVRVDLYNLKGKIYFGELTFYDNSGYINFNPKEYDDILGKVFNLPLNYSHK